MGHHETGEHYGSRTGQRHQSGQTEYGPQQRGGGSEQMPGRGRQQGGQQMGRRQQGGRRMTTTSGQHQGGQQMGGQQFGGQQMGGQQFGGQRHGYTLEETLPQIYIEALEDFEHAAAACEWCADQCLDEGMDMAECIRLCRDVADVGSLGAKFVARDSYFVSDVAEIFAEIAAECADECARHEHEHCQDCARVLDRAVDTAWELLDQTGSHSGGFQQSSSQRQLSQY